MNSLDINRRLITSVKRVSWLLIGLMFLTLLLTGCSGSTATSTVAPTAVTAVEKDKRVVLTVWTAGWKGNVEYEKFFNEVMESYRKLHPETTFDWVDLGNETGKRLDSLLSADIAGLGNAPGVTTLPDLVLLNPADLYQLAGLGKLEDLKPLVSNDQKDKYLPNAWEGLQLGNANYGIPWVGRTRVSLINKDLWQKSAKLDPTKLPKSSDELDQALPLLLKNTPDTVWSVWLRPDALTDFMMEDSKLVEVSTDGKYKVVFNNPGIQGKWQYYSDRRKDKYFFDACSDKVTADGFDCFAKSRIVILMEGGQYLPQIKTLNPDLYAKNTLVTLHPVSKSGTLPLIYQGWAVPKGAVNKDKAVEFALLVANDDNQLAFSKITQTVVPTTKKALTDPFITGQDEPLAQARSMMAAALAKTSPPDKLFPPNVGFGLRDRLLNALNIAQNAMWSGKVPPKEALAEAEKAWKDLLK